MMKLKEFSPNDAKIWEAVFAQIDGGAQQSDNSALIATVSWLAAHLASCPVVVVVRDEQLENHWTSNLLTGEFIEDMTYDMAITGNAFARLDRGRTTGIPAAVAWLPSYQVEGPRPDDSIRLGQGEVIPAGEYLHLHLARDPSNPKRGRNPLKVLMPEVKLDGDATELTQALLASRGAPWALVMPDPADRPPTPSIIEDLKMRLSNMVRGGPIVLERAFKWQFPNIAPAWDFKAVHDKAEERVSAFYHIPASVVGVGTGLEQTKVGATMYEARKAAWEDGVLPLQKRIADQLATAFPLRPGERFEFDTSGVLELQRDMAILSQVVLSQLHGGVLRVDEARAELGFEELPDTAYFMVPAGYEVVERHADAVWAEPTLPAPAPFPPEQESEPDDDEVETDEEAEDADED